MAQGDIYYVKVNCSTNNRAWSFGLHAEAIDPDTPANDAGPVARAVNAHFGSQLLAIISTESRFESIAAWRKWTGVGLAGFLNRQDSPGLRVGDSMPNDNPIFFNLRQIAGDAKFNGGIYVSGQSDSDIDGNDWDATYFSTQIQAFSDTLFTNILAVGPDTGLWRFVVLSKAFTPALLPIGTPLDIVSASASVRVQAQRRRAQKVRGYANV